MKMLLILFAYLILSIKVSHGSTNDLDEPYRIAAFGDFGDNNQTLQLKVRNELWNEHSKSPFWAGIFLGDNFYPNGVTDKEDSQFTTKIVDVYNMFDIPFLAILGNHDHLGNVQGQVKFSTHKSNPYVKKGTTELKRL